MRDESDNDYNSFLPKSYTRRHRYNPGQKLISTREELTIAQTEPGWAGDVSAWPKKHRRYWA